MDGIARRGIGVRGDVLPGLGLAGYETEAARPQLMRLALYK